MAAAAAALPLLLRLSPTMVVMKKRERDPEQEKSSILDRRPRRRISGGRLRLDAQVECHGARRADNHEGGESQAHEENLKLMRVDEWSVKTAEPNPDAKPGPWGMDWPLESRFWCDPSVLHDMRLHAVEQDEGAVPLLGPTAVV